MGDQVTEIWEEKGVVVNPSGGSGTSPEDEIHSSNTEKGGKGCGHKGEGGEESTKIQINDFSLHRKIEKYT